MLTQRILEVVRAVARFLPLAAPGLLLLFACPSSSLAIDSVGGAPSALRRVSLQLRWDHQYQFAGYYAAAWQGYYAAAGFEVDIRSATAPDGGIRSATHEVAAARADFGVGAADILIARDQGSPLVVLASIFQQSAAEFYGREDRQLRAPADLLQLKVARTVNDLIDLELQVMLLSEGIDPKKIHPYPHIPGIAHLVDGRVDVVPGYRIAAPFEFKAQGIPAKTLRPINFGIDFYGDSLFTHARLVKEDPAAVERFRRATIQGWEYALEHPFEIADRISRELPRTAPIKGGTAHDFNRFQVDGVKELTLYSIVPVGTVNPHRWRRMHELMSRVGILTGPLNTDDLIFDAERLFHTEEERFRRVAGVVLLATTAAAAVAFLWLLLLRRIVARRTRELHLVNERLERELGERKRAEEKTVLLLERLNLAARAASLGIWDWDIPKNELVWDDRMYELYGLRREDFGGAHEARLAGLHPDDRAASDEVSRQALSGARDYDTEFRVVWPDGTVRVLKAYGVVVRGSGGEPLRMTGVNSDITEHRRAEAALRDRDEKLQRLSASIPGFIAYVNAETLQYEYVNDAYPRSFSLPIDRIVGSHIREVIGEKNFLFALPYINEVRQGRPASYENSFDLASGRRWVQVNFTPVTEADGRVSSIAVLTYDITERKMAEGALQEREREFRTLVENLAAGVVVHGADTAILIANRMAGQLLGLTEDQMRGKTATDPAWKFIKADGAPLPLAEYPVNRVLSSGLPLQDCLLGIRRPDRANPTWVVCNAYPVNDEDGKLLKIVVTFSDVTELKRVEVALQQRVIALTQPLEGGTVAFEELFDIVAIQSLQDQFAQATGVASLITRPDGTPITAPTNFTRLCSEIIRKTEKGVANCRRSDAALGRYHPEGPTVQPCLSGGLWDAGAAISVGGHHVANWLIGQVRDESQTEERMLAYAREIGADDTAFMEAFHAVPSMSREQFELVAKTLFTLANQLSTSAYQNIQQARFIADRARAEADRDRLAGERAGLEEQLRQSQKMEAIGRLAGGVAHDFNNITAIILGYGELLQGHLGPDDPTRKYVEQIMAAGNRSAALTRQLLAFGRKQTLQFEALDLNELLCNFEKTFGRLIGEDIQLEMKLGAVPGRVTADAGQLEQVVTNLVINARDAMPRGGRLVLETADIELDEIFALGRESVVPGTYVLLAVTDTGCGMDTTALSRLFEPFYTTKQKGKGTGLGLATAYGIVRQFGGHIRVSSEPGVGTTFKIFLPSTSALPQTRPAEPDAVTPRSSGELILLVEDEAPLRQLCETVLARLGYRVIAAADGQEALRLVQEQGIEPALLLTDVIMPGMSGAALAQRLLVARPGLGVLYMSGYPDDAIAPHGVLALGTHFIQKPFTERSLAVKIGETLAGRTGSKRAGRRVLMIDDDEQYRELVQHCVRKRGHTFVGADSEAAALAALTESAVDVLLVDLNIPGTSGERILREIRAAGHAAPAIILTGDVASADMATLGPLGAVRALEKSSDCGPLLLAVEAL